MTLRYGLLHPHELLHQNNKLTYLSPHQIFIHGLWYQFRNYL